MTKILIDEHKRKLSFNFDRQKYIKILQDILDKNYNYKMKGGVKK